MTRFQIPPAASPQENPYLPKGPPDPLLFEQFNGIDTQTSRPGVDDKQMYWCDGFMPISPRKLRTLYGIGPALWTAPSNAPVSFFDFGNIGSTPIMIGMHADGGIWQINTSTSVATRIADDGVITNPSRLTVGISQYGSEYILIISAQTDGYFIWDGSVFYFPGSLAPKVTITDGGSGYTSAPTCTASGGSGSGATFDVTVAGGIVTAVTITDPGDGYLAGESVTLGFSGGGGSSAAATVELMPLAISGTELEIYAGRVWIANGATITYSAPGSFTDFSSASGGGNFTSSDSFLRVGYKRVLQTNGFLYLIADSSINYISGVQTGGLPPVTTFTNQNADPEVGTPWPSTVTTFGRNILFANAFGAHVSYGASINKISDALDGVYNTVPNFGALVPSSAKAIVFGKRVWILLLPIIDPITGQQTNKLFLWDSKRWWACSQDVPLFYIATQEIDSVLTAYGTDGANVYPLFQAPSTDFSKVVQSKLWDKPGGYQFTKSASRFWGILQYYNPLSTDVTISIDNESTSNDYTVASPVAMTWTTLAGATMNWTTLAGDAMVWQAAGIGVIEPTAIGQSGALIGMTATTSCADMAIISLAIGDQIEQYRG